MAAVDVGSNAIRFVVADFRAPVSFAVVRKRREAVRLGRSVFASGDLSERAMDRAVAAMAGFRREMETLGVERHRAVATSATREAGNGDVFLERVREEARLALEPIDGAEEMRLARVAVATRVDLAKDRWALVDLGGGSADVAGVDDASVLWSASHPVGTVRLLEAMAAAQARGRCPLARIDRLLGRLTAQPPAPHPKPDALAATGGNVESIARLALGRAAAGRAVSLSRRRLDGIVDLLARTTERERRRDLGLRPDRADVILPAALVYRRVMELVGVDRVSVPFVGIKEGTLLDLARLRAASPDAESAARRPTVPPG